MSALIQALLYLLPCNKTHKGKINCFNWNIFTPITTIKTLSVQYSCKYVRCSSAHCSCTSALLHCIADYTKYDKMHRPQHCAHKLWSLSIWSLISHTDRLIGKCTEVFQHHWWTDRSVSVSVCPKWVQFFPFFWWYWLNIFVISKSFLGDYSTFFMGHKPSLGVSITKADIDNEIHEK